MNVSTCKLVSAHVWMSHVRRINESCPTYAWVVSHMNVAGDQYRTRCNTLNTLQHTATLCNTLQHTATLCNTLQHTATHCNTLQHTATHCNTLQHTATHCSITLTNVGGTHTQSYSLTRTQSYSLTCTQSYLSHAHSHTLSHAHVSDYHARIHNRWASCYQAGWTALILKKIAG